MRAKLIRSLVLILILPLVAIIFSPSSGVLADCTSGSGIKVDNGLISTYSTGSFEAGSGVSCIESSRAVIPQFALTTYDEMKTLYYDQATCVNCKNPLPLNGTGNQIQSTPKFVIDLSSGTSIPPIPTLIPSPTTSPPPPAPPTPPDSDFCTVTGDPILIDTCTLEISDTAISI